MKQERAIRTRRVIVNAAAEVFSRQGYERATIAEIIRTAGLTKGALYFHFASKEELASVVMAEHTDYLPRSESESPLQRAIDYSQTVARAMGQDSLVRAGTRLTVEGTFERAPDPYGQWATSLGELFREARASGEILRAIDDRAVVELLVGAFTGLNLMSYVRSGQQDLPRRVADMWRYLLPGIANPAVLGSLRVDGSGLDGSGLDGSGLDGPVETGDPAGDDPVATPG